MSQTPDERRGGEDVRKRRCEATAACAARAAPMQVMQVASKRWQVRLAGVGGQRPGGTCLGPCMGLIDWALTAGTLPAASRHRALRCRRSGSLGRCTRTRSTWAMASTGLPRWRRVSARRMLKADSASAPCWRSNDHRGLGLVDGVAAEPLRIYNLCAPPLPLPSPGHQTVVRTA